MKGDLNSFMLEQQKIIEKQQQQINSLLHVQQQKKIIQEQKEYIDRLNHVETPKYDNTEKKLPKIDLHGHSLEKSNKIVKKFILDSFNSGYKKILIVTGKGSRSKSYDNPYISDKLSVLKYSIPEFIRNNENLNSKIKKISKAEIRDGGEGAFYIYFKKNKNL